jgi:purine-cytosine permease-like protein
MAGGASAMFCLIVRAIVFFGWLGDQVRCCASLCVKKNFGWLGSKCDAVPHGACVFYFFGWPGVNLCIVIAV